MTAKSQTPASIFKNYLKYVFIVPDLLCRQRCLQWYNGSLITRDQRSVTDATFSILSIQDIGAVSRGISVLDNRLQWLMFVNSL